MADAAVTDDSIHGQSQLGTLLLSQVSRSCGLTIDLPGPVVHTRGFSTMRTTTWQRFQPRFDIAPTAALRKKQ
jgi:hypothetical protein